MTLRKNSALAKATGQTLYPGSLNLLLSRPVRFARPAAIRFARNHCVWPATLNGQPVWLCRWATAPLHVVEVLATEHLRSQWALNDGDRLELHLAAALLEPLPVIDRLVHTVVWAGRGRWYYAADSYVFGWVATRIGGHATQDTSVHERLRQRLLKARQ